MTLVVSPSQKTNKNKFYMKTGFFLGFNGAELFYRVWNYMPNQKTIIALHRGHEHSGRMEDLATDYHFDKYNIFSFDLRGHGYTPEPVSGTFMDYVRDFDCFVKYLNDEYAVSTENIFVIANSISSVIVSAWVHDFAPRIAGMALLAPAFNIKLYIPFAKEFVALGTKIQPSFNVKSYVKSKVLTHDRRQQKAYDRDPLITKSIDARMLVDFLDGGKRIVEDAAAIDTPTIIFSAGKDYVVNNSDQKEFFLKLSTQDKDFIKLPNSYHGILFETGRDFVYEVIADFVQESFSRQMPLPNLDADKFTEDEYLALSLRAIPEIENLNYSFQKWSLNKIGEFSDGMKIGLQYGFDSGVSLDYVYRNRPKGKHTFGVMMDYFYLNAIGWRGVRMRKINLLKQLESQILQLKQNGEEVKILDIAGGSGNYLFKIKEKYPDVEIVVNDFKEENIYVGANKIERKGITGMRFTNHDCFDPESYSKLDFEPNITIISGIFELFSDNNIVSNAISGVASISAPNSSVIYTGQPWHPQLKTIAYVLNSHKGTDWVMRRRAQKELDKVFRYNGIEKESMLIDDYGIFTVSCGKIKKEPIQA